MGGAPIPFACTLVPPATTCTGTFADVTVYSEPSPYPPGKLAVFVFQDDFPLNGEHDGGGGGVGGIDTTIASNEQGLGQFQIHLWDAFGGSGDFTGQMSYDMFNQPLSNSLAGTIDPATGFDACPISTNPRNAADPTSTGITGMIVTCPTFESDKKTFSPLAGQAVIANLMPGKMGRDCLAWGRPDSEGGRSGSRLTLWTARRPTMFSPESASRTSSRNTDRRDSTCPSVLPTRKSLIPV